MNKRWNHRFNFKPLSANKMFYRGKQLTKEYRLWREQIWEDIEDRSKWPFEPEEKLEVNVEVGFSSKLADLDNAIKPLLDTFQYMFGFNDKWIFEIHLHKEIVSKGEEFFEVTVIPYEEKQ